MIFELALKDWLLTDFPEFTDLEGNAVGASHKVDADVEAGSGPMDVNVDVQVVSVLPVEIRSPVGRGVRWTSSVVFTVGFDADFAYQGIVRNDLTRHISRLATSEACLLYTSPSPRDS